MVGLTALWLPVLVSAVVVFLASAVIHMALRYHWSDYQALSGEDNLAAAFRAEKIAPGNYNIPHADSMKELQNPETIKKFEAGPVGFITILPSGAPKMGKQLMLWFLYSVVVGILAAYLTGRTVAPGADYLRVFRVAGTAAFLAYCGAEPVASIWLGRKWSTTAKNMLDGLFYALLTAGVFAWLWPS